MPDMSKSKQSTPTPRGWQGNGKGARVLRTLDGHMSRWDGDEPIDHGGEHDSNVYEVD